MKIKYVEGCYCEIMKIQISDNNYAIVLPEYEEKIIKDKMVECTQVICNDTRCKNCKLESGYPVSIDL